MPVLTGSPRAGTSAPNGAAVSGSVAAPVQHRLRAAARSERGEARRLRPGCSACGHLHPVGGVKRARLRVRADADADGDCAVADADLADAAPPSVVDELVARGDLVGANVCASRTDRRLRISMRGTAGSASRARTLTDRNRARAAADVDPGRTADPPVPGLDEKPQRQRSPPRCFSDAIIFAGEAASSW